MTRWVNYRKITLQRDFHGLHPYRLTVWRERRGANSTLESKGDARFDCGCRSINNVSLIPTLGHVYMTNRARYPRESWVPAKSSPPSLSLSRVPPRFLSLALPTLPPPRASSPRSRGVEGGGRLIRHGARAQSPPLDIMCLPDTHTRTHLT